MATVKINGKEITVPDGTSILDAARQAGFKIPTFCYLSDLSPLGSCRMCLVEIAGQRKMQPSCVTPVLHGMEVLTETETVKSARSSMLGFLLANHPLDCPVCDKGGECELQDLTFKYGPRYSPFSEWKRKFHDRDEVLSPVIVKNHNRCIHCERCVRICSEVVGANALSGLGRGHKTKETSFMNGPLDCDQCGNCVEVCPVGSFMNLPYRYKSRPWDLKETDTVCPYCATGCQLTIGARNGEIVRVKSKVETGLNREWLCARGRYGYHFIQSDKRLKKPMVRKNGALVETSWEEALSVIKQKFGSGKKTAGIASARQTNEDLFVFQKLVREVFKTNHIDMDSRWANKKVTAAMIDVCGLADGGVSIFDALKTDVIFIIGSAISSENPITDYLIRTTAADKRKNIILTHPRRIKLDSAAGISLKYKPGTEAEVIKGIIDGMERGGAQGDVAAIVKKLKNAASITVFLGADILRLDNDALNWAAALKGLLKKAGKNIIVQPLFDRCNQRGAMAIGVHPSFLPGLEKSPEEGMDCGEILDAAKRGEIESLYILGEDIVSMFPDAQFAKDALAKIKFKAVQDTFLSETAKTADVVLPGATYAEKDGTFTNQEGRVQRVRKAIDPVSDARDDLRILCDVGGFAYKSAKEVFEDIKKAVQGYRDISFDGLNNTGAFVKGHGTEVRSRESGVRSQRREAREDSEYPFLLITGNHLFHSGILSQKSEVLRQLLSEPFVELSDADAAALGIKDSGMVTVKGMSYEARLKARIKQGSAQGVAFIAENFEDVRVNRFFKRGEGIPRVKISK